jgi:hypothetical protein
MHEFDRVIDSLTLLNAVPAARIEVPLGAALAPENAVSDSRSPDRSSGESPHSDERE